MRVVGKEEQETTSVIQYLFHPQPVHAVTLLGDERREKENESLSRIGCALSTQSTGTSELIGAMKLYLELTSIAKCHSHQLSQHTVQSL